MTHDLSAIGTPPAKPTAAAAEIRTHLAEQQGHDCPLGLTEIQEALNRFPTRPEAVAYLTAKTERFTAHNGYRNHKGQLIATGPAGETLNALERELKQRDLYIVRLEQRLEALRQSVLADITETGHIYGLHTGMSVSEKDHTKWSAYCLYCGWESPPDEYHTTGIALDRHPCGPQHSPETPDA